jgi:hypothetical protein
VPAFDRVKRPLNGALECARRIGQIAASLLGTQGIFTEDLRILRRDLVHLCRQTVAAFPGDDYPRADLQHEMTCVQEDAFLAADWAINTARQLQTAQNAITTLGGYDPVATHRYNELRTRAFQEVNTYQTSVTNACSRAYAAANQICSGADDAEKRATELVPSTPTPETASGSPPLTEHPILQPKTSIVSDYFINLDQASALVNRSKRTLERCKKKMPQPRVKGGGGKPSEWAWSDLKPWLENEFGRMLPPIPPHAIGK